MPQNGVIYRVLVASPSDCSLERQLVPDVIHAWNATHSFAEAAIVEPVLWETHARPELGDRPQAIINKQLVENCDILVGTFWTRLGTATGRAASGTAEEIEEFRSKGKPVLLYFSGAPVAADSLDPDQYKALREYRAVLEKNGLCFRYETLEQLREMLHRHIAQTMTNLHVGNASAAVASAADPQVAQLEELARQFGAFLRRFQAEWGSERDSDPDGIDDGKYILSSALDDVLTIRSQIISGLPEVVQILDEVSKGLRALQRHQLYMDGGNSFREFWRLGDELTSKLEAARELFKLELAQLKGENAPDSSTA